MIDPSLSVASHQRLLPSLAYDDSIPSRFFQMQVIASLELFILMTAFHYLV